MTKKYVYDLSYGNKKFLILITMDINIIKAKATLDVDYCASERIFDNIKNFDVDDLFAIFAISRKWALKVELDIAKLDHIPNKTSEEFEALAKLNQKIVFLNNDFVKSFAKMLNQRRDDVASRVRTWCCVYVQFAGELQLMREFVDLCTKHEKERESRADSIKVCDALWRWFFAAEVRLAQLENWLL